LVRDLSPTTGNSNCNATHVLTAVLKFRKRGVEFVEYYRPAIYPKEVCLREENYGGVHMRAKGVWSSVCLAGYCLVSFLLSIAIVAIAVLLAIFLPWIHDHYGH